MARWLVYVLCLLSAVLLVQPQEANPTSEKPQADEAPTVQPTRAMLPSSTVPPLVHNAQNAVTNATEAVKNVTKKVENSTPKSAASSHILEKVAVFPIVGLILFSY